VEDRQLAVGDRVVCGHNAIAELGVANGSRGVVTALDPQARSLTVRLDGTDGREVSLPRSYLDGRGERNRRVDLAYATTGHRAQGLTRGRALVRLTGSEDINWLYVQLSRARHDTRLYAVVGPEPQGGGELDLPDRDQPDAYLQLAQALSRGGGQALAIDTRSSPDLGRLSTAELRAERDRLRRQLDQAPPDRSRELEQASAHCQQAEQILAAYQQPTDRRPAGMLRWRRRGEEPARIPGGLAVAPSRPIGPTTRSASCVSTGSAARAGWRSTPTSAPSIARWCGPWPGSAGPPAWPLKPTGPAMSWRPSGQFPSRPGVGGPGARPPPRSSNTGTPTASPIRTGPAARSRTTEPNEPLGSGPARPSSASRPSSAPSAAPVMPG
jgi:hypothetical protein